MTRPSPLMKTKLIALLAVISFILTDTDTMNAQEIQFPAPVTTGGMPANELIARRHSCREFDSARSVDQATLGQLLWMTLGINRPDAQPTKFGAPANRTNPTALNSQEITAYVFTTDGVYEYLPASHSQRKAVDGDHRALLTGTEAFRQEFVLDAPLSILLVADTAKLPEGDMGRAMALVDAGIADGNLNVAAESLGLATVPRATMDSAAVSRLLGLASTQLPVINNPIGYAK